MPRFENIILLYPLDWKMRVFVDGNYPYFNFLCQEYHKLVGSGTVTYLDNEQYYVLQNITTNETK